jgi:hypothetical protein
LTVNPNEPYDPNGFGEGRFMEFEQAITNVYAASNQSINLGEDATPADNNSGEQILAEGTGDLIYSPILSATSDTFTIFGNYATGAVGLTTIVTSGSGLGQQSTITAAAYDPDANATTYTINKVFAVIPAAGSNVDVASAPTNMVFYQNTLNHTTGAYASEDDASSGFEFFNGASGIVLDGNTVNNTRYGARFWSAGVSFPVSAVDVVNNTFSQVQIGVELYPDARSDPNFYAVAVRNNSISGDSTSYMQAVAGIDLDPFGQPVPATLSVFEHNTVTGFPIGFEAANDPDSLAYSNSFSLGSATYNGSSGIYFGTSPSGLILNGNIFSGFEADPATA